MEHSNHNRGLYTNSRRWRTFYLILLVGILATVLALRTAQPVDREEMTSRVYLTAPETTTSHIYLGTQGSTTNRVYLEIPDASVEEFSGGEGVYTGFISGQGFHHQEVQYSLLDGKPIVEGDILLQLDANEPVAAGVGIPFRNYRWTDGIVPYEIDPNLPAQDRVRDAIAHWEAVTDIHFIERTSRNQGQYPNYVFFQPSAGCSSYVGMMGGRQPINLADGCTTGSTIHEIGHAVGLWHEQSRADRDNYVTIHYENIQLQYVFNFNQNIQDGEDIGLYDYDSIMHYPRWAFSKNGKDTITPHGDQEIGHRDGLSAGDIEAAKFMYRGIIRERGNE